MYLSDRRIRSLVPNLHIETSNPDFPFAPDDQIQPCSIDLRLCHTFWEPRKKRTTIDLRRAKLLELSPRRYWKRIALAPGETINIKPGRLLLGRTYERFQVPPNCAGKIEGRSSFARMGLMVHCTGDFINPGWRGHMTLQLVNAGANTIRLVPYLPVCQLKLVDLGEVPQRLYGEVELQSKYMDDDGGPSYWWRDKRIRELREQLGETDVTVAIQERVLEVIGVEEPEVVERFERYIDAVRVQQLEHAAALLDGFAAREDRLRFWAGLTKNVITAFCPLLFATSLGMLTQSPVGFWHYFFWSGAILSAPVSLWAYRWDPGEFFGQRELRARRQIAAGPDGNAE